MMAVTRANFVSRASSILTLTFLFVVPSTWAQSPTVGTNDPDGRMTAADRAHAGIGRAVEDLPPASSLTPDQARDRLFRWQQEIRHALFIPDMLPPLRAKVWSTFSPMPGVLVDRVTYNTADGMLVPAIVYYPDPKLVRSKMPGIVIVNGHGGDKFSWYAMYSGLLFAKAGAVVVTYDPIGEGERNEDKKSRVGSHDAWVSPPAGLARTDWGQRLAGLMQVDAMQAVSYLGSRPDVDAKRIGLAGYSMGGFIAGITGAVDPRIHAVLISGGGVYDGPGGYLDANPLPCQMPPYKALLPVLGDRGAVLYALNAMRGPLLVMNGADDRVMDIEHHPSSWFAEQRVRAEALLGPKAPAVKNLFTTIVYPGVSHRPSWVDRDGIAWFNQQLHFALWTEQTIASEPTTNIGDWVRSNQVDVPPDFFKHLDREAGIDAVGKGYPAIPRTALMVLPPDAWQHNEDRLVYSAWAAKTREEEAIAARRTSDPNHLSQLPQERVQPR